MIGMMMQYRCPQKSQASRHLIAGPWRLMFIAALVGCMAWLLTATPVAAGETLPCEVMVKFEDDDAGVATIYRLRLQHKNRKGRDVSHVSVMTATADGAPIGNSHVSAIVNDDIKKLKSTLSKFKGSSPVYFDIHDSKNEFKLNMISEDTKVKISKELLISLEEDEFLYKLN